MITSSNANGKKIRVTGSYLGESIGHRWIPFTKASDTELFEQAIEIPVIWDAIALIKTSL